MKLNELTDNPGARRTAFVWPGHRLRQGQDRRARRQRSEGALRVRTIKGFEGGQMPLHMRLPSAASTIRCGSILCTSIWTACRDAIDAGKLSAKDVIDAEAADRFWSAAA